VVEARDNHTNDDHRDAHHDRSDYQHGLAANLVDDQHGGDSRNDENDASDTCNMSVNASIEDFARPLTSRKQGDCSLRQAKTLEDIGGIVDDRIDARPLLEEHDEPDGDTALGIIPGSEAANLISLVPGRRRMLEDRIVRSRRATTTRRHRLGQSSE
jgi:hypothetical protein